MTDLIPRDAAIAAVTEIIDQANKRGLSSVATIAMSCRQNICVIPAIDHAAIREAAMREAVQSLRDWQNNLIRHRYKETAITVGMSADVVESLIGEKK